MPCVRVTPLPARVEIGGRLELRLSFDPALEPDFRGRLAVELTGLGRSGEVLFRSAVDLTVGKGAPIQTRLLEPIHQVSGSFSASFNPSREAVP